MDEPAFMTPFHDNTGDVTVEGQRSMLKLYHEKCRRSGTLVFGGRFPNPDTNLRLFFIIVQKLGRRIYIILE